VSDITVLVVDDQRLFAESIARVLDEAVGIGSVGIAATAAEAREAAARTEPDVVLMDFRLPDGNGIDAASAILDARPATKVIMLTAAEDESIFLRAIEAGCAGFLTKDQAIDELEDAVRTVHAGDPLIRHDTLARVLRNARATSTNGHTRPLTDRELQVLEFMASALTPRQIARRLHLSEKTVRNYVQGILVKLGCHSKLEAVLVATRRGIIPPVS